MYRLAMAGILVVAAPALWAEEAGRGVARVSLVNGEITMQRGDSGDWVAAAVNAPLVTGDKIFAAQASRAEVQLDYSNFLRLGENTEVRMADLENRRYQMQVSKGVVTYRILRENTGQVEINTPAVAVRPLERGAYRIEVQENGETEITVRDGEAEVYSGQGTERLREGQTMIARVGPNDRAVEVQVVRAAGRDEWDRWNERRDKQVSEAQSRRYVHSSVWGVEDLDAYGSWRDVEGYGHCWFPSGVAVDWSPYSYGRWGWVDWYGWTWIGYEPWGWAPYHWGRWYRHPRWGWGWYPGSIYTHSYWSPAVVGFFGWGGRHSGVGIGFGYGNVGWVPLAPGDPFYPWWGRGYYGRGRTTYIDNSVHITNVTNIRNVYRNAGVNGGIVSVATEDFARGRVVNPRRVNVAEVGNAGQIRGLVPVAPEQESLRMSDRSVRATPRSEGRDRFFTHQQPAAVERVPFAEQRQQIERSVRGAGAVRGSEEATGRLGERATGRGGETGWRRFGEDRRVGPQAVTPSQNTERPVERSNGWRRMGEDRRVEPQAVTAPPAAVERRREPEMQRFPAPARDRAPQPQPQPQVDRSVRGSGDVFRRSEPQMHEQRRIELNRPIVVPRNEGGGHGGGGGGGGARMSAPQQAAPRGDGGGGRSGERSGGGGGGGRGRR